MKQIEDYRLDAIRISIDSANEAAKIGNHVGPENIELWAKRIVGFICDGEFEYVAPIPTFYDIGTDTKRPITQADVDALVAVASAYGSLRETLKDADRAHIAMTNQIRADRGLEPLESGN